MPHPKWWEQNLFSMLNQASVWCTDAITKLNSVPLEGWSYCSKYLHNSSAISLLQIQLKMNVVRSVNSKWTDELVWCSAN